MTRTVTGEILAIGGPEGGRSNDLTLTNAWDAVLGLLVVGERALADRMWRRTIILCILFLNLERRSFLVKDDSRFLTPGHTLVEYDEEDMTISTLNIASFNDDRHLF